jgi:AraC-like DNA-binding protein
MKSGDSRAPFWTLIDIFLGIIVNGRGVLSQRNFLEAWTMSNRSRIRLCMAHMLPAFLRAEMRDVGSVFAHAGLAEPAPRIPHDQVVVRGQFCALLEHCARVTDDPLVGVRIVESGVDPSQLGVFGTSLFQDGTVFDCLQAHSRFAATMHERNPMGIARSDDGVFWFQRFLGSTFEDVRILTEASAYFMLEVLREHLGPEWTPAFIQFPHRAQTLRRHYEEKFRAPVIFRGVDGTKIALDPPSLRARTRKTPAWRSFEIKSLAALGEQFHELIENPSKSFNEEIDKSLSRIVDGLMMANRVSINIAAKALGYSVRSLQRALAAEGWSFEELVERRRRVRSLELLANPDLKIAEVAMALAYSDSPHFIRAFRRWYRQSPSEFRRKISNLDHV